MQFGFIRLKSRVCTPRAADAQKPSRCVPAAADDISYLADAWRLSRRRVQTPARNAFVGDTRS
ncbi:MAG: hypothetical protein D6744_07155 [Planctomycetota bacterium]|nr:MAG: hypothetical protein D6744_07155 [Planctomycetota bacterium]